MKHSPEHRYSVNDTTIFGVDVGDFASKVAIAVRLVRPFMNV